MKRQNGFTLIELVVVIVILGILAVTAAPRFLNFQGDARKASLQGLKGAIDGAAGITYGAAALAGIDTKLKTDSPAPSINDITTHYGYPTATPEGIGKAVIGLDSDWEAQSPAVATIPTSIRYSFKGNTKWGTTSAACNVIYTEATSSAAPSTQVFSGC
ncbi:MAG: type II secretion system protein [Vibrio sp.]|nr:type II secretion system protein [Vibrio sp.]